MLCLICGTRDVTGGGNYCGVCTKPMGKPRPGVHRDAGSGQYVSKRAGTTASKKAAAKKAAAPAKKAAPSKR